MRPSWPSRTQSRQRSQRRLESPGESSPEPLLGSGVATGSCSDHPAGERTLPTRLPEQRPRHARAPLPDPPVGGGPAGAGQLFLVGVDSSQTASMNRLTCSYSSPGRLCLPLSSRLRTRSGSVKSLLPKITAARVRYALACRKCSGRRRRTVNRPVARARSAWLTPTWCHGDVPRLIQWSFISSASTCCRGSPPSLTVWGSLPNTSRISSHFPAYRDTNRTIVSKPAYPLSAKNSFEPSRSRSNCA